MLMDDPPTLAARADVCRLLAASYYEPCEAFAQEKMFDMLAQAAATVDAELGQTARRLAAAFAAEDPQTLLVDYARLFLGPPRPLAAPYGSVWLGDTQPLMQDSTAEVLALYGDGGFEVADDFRDLPDHIAAELEFLYLLLFREAAARHSGDADARAAAAALRRRLLDEHLGRWIGPFAAALREHAQTAFSRELAALTERFVGIVGGTIAAR
jgi:TorA maturation chaperone TorD